MIRLPRFFQPIHVANVLLILLFIPARLMSPALQELTATQDQHTGLRRDLCAVVVLGVFFVFRSNRKATWDHKLLDLFVWTKSLILASFWMSNVVMGLWYSFLCLCVWLVFPLGHYQGESKVEMIDGKGRFAHLLGLAGKGPLLDKTLEVTWLILFYKPFRKECSEPQVVIANLSLKYTSERLRFGKVDISRNAVLAKRFQIDVRTHATLIGQTSCPPSSCSREDRRPRGRHRATPRASTRALSTPRTPCARTSASTGAPPHSNERPGRRAKATLRPARS
mmetsp:Transcript_30361/g.75378  ORF Transcript_30361/g.75378 Transcript_30361/m.75378 type:complete len:280 (-) Transcript_30361:402-1241(-)